YIIWNINEDGYLSITVDDVARNLSTPPDKVIAPEKVEKILAMIQTLEPPGIGSRNLQECLLVQLRENNGQNRLSIDILTRYYDDFKNKRFEKLVKNLNVTIDEIKEAIEQISRLNPKPGEGYINTNENYVVPDIIVEKIGNELIVSINEGNVPQLRINNAYRRMLTDGSKISDDTKKYIHHRIESARWLINSIQQRKTTMIKVMKEIIYRQTDFFDKGGKFLRPMILKDIAEAIGMDISTISRVTNGKY
ncbi:MAG: RNA polymerase sigma-54 factor, partial [bacterium]|nr:RNA polymerase sigma-54 factor [bacterium]